MGHSFHSIFTLGTVLILDFLFLLSRPSDLLRQHIFPLFPTISKVIWVGLAIDFLSVSLVFQEALRLTPKFFFMQTVIAILILNGIWLGGPIARKLMHSMTEGGEAMTRRWMNIASIAGGLSVSSWGTITFMDSFENLPFAYWQYALGYLALIAILFLGHVVMERFTKGHSYIADNKLTEHYYGEA